LATEIVEEIENIFEEVEEVFEELEFVQIEELFEEFVALLEEPPLEEELSFEPVLMVVEEMPTEEVAMEVEEEITMEVEETIEEEIMEMQEEEEFVEAEPEEIIEESNEEEIKEEKPTSETPAKSSVQTKKIAKQKNIQQKKADVKNLTRVMDKVDKDIKNISKNLQVKNIIKLEAMVSDQVSLDMYQATSFYKPKDIYLDQLNIVDTRLIYADKSLATYTQNDKIEIKAKKLGELNLKKQQLLNELEILKNGQT
jgi:hypothetical protein